MRRIIITGFSVLIVAGFTLLIHHAYVQRRGAPATPAGDAEKILLRVPYRDSHIDLSTDSLRPEPWDSIEGITVPMTYQVTIEPWGNSLIPFIHVKAFHNGRDICFKMTYPDATLNDSITIAGFSDGASVMFPLGARDTVNPESIMMGFQGRVNIWHWRAYEDREYRRGMQSAASNIPLPVTDLIASGIGTLAAKKLQKVSGRGYRTKDGWEIVMTRGLTAGNPAEDMHFAPAQTFLCAFAVWDGELQDRGPRKSISGYIELAIGEKP